MAHRRLHPEVPGQEAPDGAGLGGALNDDEGVTHRQVDDRIPLYRIGRPMGREQRRYSHPQQTLADEPL
jgi:hypothetical protein